MLDFSKIEPVFLDEDKPYLSLSAVAKESRYREDFILAAIRKGELKAFKLGDDWLINEDWYLEWHERIRRSIDDELSVAGAPFSRQNKWLRPLSRPEPGFAWVHYSWVVGFWFFLTVFLGGASFFWSSVGLVSFNDSRVAVGSMISFDYIAAQEKFLSAVDKIGQSPVRLALAAGQADYPINDEAITDFLAGLLKREGRVAGEEESTKP